MEKVLNTEWNVYIHKKDDENWDDNSYKHIYTINSLESLKKFMIYFNEYNANDNYIYVMRNKIKPRWEHNDNMNGGKYTAILHNIMNDKTKMLFGTEAFLLLLYMMINETISEYPDVMNGISYVLKKNFVNIQSWWKDYDKNSENVLVSNEIVNEINKKYREINNDRKKIIHDLFKKTKILKDE